jgi:hypothetical protein
MLQATQACYVAAVKPHSSIGSVLLFTSELPGVQ